MTPGRRSVVLAVAACALMLFGCNKPYRVGEHVWVEWDGRDYPAYIVELRGASRLRVHFESYDTRWDEDVTLDRVKGRVEGPVTPPPPPDKVTKAAAATAKGAGSAQPVASFKIGDRVRVRWRGSVYPATIIGVVASEKFLVHYDGYESAWDEVVQLDRVVGTRL